MSNSACCSLPPVSADYTPKGSYSEVAGLKSYIVGPEDTKSVILFVYDIFGWSPQILQGADLLASQGYKVVMPDFLKGDLATPDMFSGTEEGNAKRTKFFSGFPGAIDSQSAPTAKVAEELKKGGVKLGSVGACWGYKVLITTEGISHFDAIAGIHPSFAAADDADKVSVPLALLPSSGEDMDVINKIHTAVEGKNKGKNVLKHFPDMPHGWMAARGDLKDEKSKKQYVEGYQTLVDFFKANL